MNSIDEDVLAEFDNRDFRIRVTQRTRDGKFLSTLWNKHYEREDERFELEFETFGAACNHAFNGLCNLFYVMERKYQGYVPRDPV